LSEDRVMHNATERLLEQIEKMKRDMLG
jgi:hypothetical protein